jgi:hypothetical protein
MRTEKSRLRRSLTSLQELMQRLRHHTIGNRSAKSTPPYAATMLITASPEIFGVVERYWRRMLCSRSWVGRRLTWDVSTESKNGHRC